MKLFITRDPFMWGVSEGRMSTQEKTAREGLMSVNNSHERFIERWTNIRKGTFSLVDDVTVLSFQRVSLYSRVDSEPSRILRTQNEAQALLKFFIIYPTCGGLCIIHV